MEEKKIYSVMQDCESTGIYLKLTEEEYDLVKKIFTMAGIYGRDLMKIEIGEF